MTDEEREDKIN